MGSRAGPTLHHMRAFLLTRNDTPDRAFELRDFPVPPVPAGHIRIRVSVFGLNYADVMMRQGLYRGAPDLPYVMGYDVEGTVDAVGEGVTEFAPGDRVFALTRFGGYSEYAVTPAIAAGHLEAGAGPGLGCALATQCVTAYYVCDFVQTLLPGETILLHAAAGGLGTAVIQYALSRGCTVIAVVGGQAKADYVRGLGVQHAVDHHVEDYGTYIGQHFQGRVDVILNNAGGASVRKDRKLLAKGGRLVLLGAAALSGRKSKLALLKLAWGFGFYSPIGFMGKSQSLIGVNMLVLADRRPDIVGHCFREVSRLHATGVFRPTIGRLFEWGQLAEAHQLLEDRRSIGKFAVRWTD